ncbi:MAG: hypothetical protein WBC91_26710, partial [Phototrophicaceae bacterium]
IMYGYLTAVSLASASSNHELLIIPTIESLNNFTKIFGALYPLTPFILLGFYVSLKENDSVLIFLAFALLIILYGTLILESTETYKLVLFGSTFATLITVSIIHRPSIILEQNNAPISMAIPLITGLYLLVSLNIITFSGGTLIIDKTGWEGRGYSYNGQTINIAAEPYSDVYIWLREEIDSNTQLIMRPNDTIFAPLMSEHLPFVSDLYYSTAFANLPEWGERTSLVYRLINEPIEDPKWQLAWDTLQANPDSASYIYVFPNDLPSNAESLEAFGFDLLFTGESASAYRYSDE